MAIKCKYMRNDKKKTYIVRDSVYFALNVKKHIYYTEREDLWRQKKNEQTIVSDLVGFCDRITIKVFFFIICDVLVVFFCLNNKMNENRLKFYFYFS